MAKIFKGGGGEHISIFYVICVVWGRYIWFLLNNKIFTFHDLFTFTESIDKQPLFNLLQYIIIWVWERDIVNCLLILQIYYL